MMVVGTATAVGMALANSANGRRLAPVFVGATPSEETALGEAEARVGHFPDPREFVARRILLAAVIAVAVLLLAASVPALTALASSLRSPAGLPTAYGPPKELRAASGVGGDWARAYNLSAPPASQLGAALIAGAQEQYRWDVLRAMRTIADAETARQAQADAAAATSQRSAAAPYTLHAPSGVAPGTVLRARITIYGCTGPGGGFCGHMSSGIQAFPGAAACSSNLPFGTRLKIDGDPTGRVYECLDRGALTPTWIDVFFNDTSEGMAWQSQLGTTVANITIVN